MNAVAEIAGVSRGTVVNARKELAKEARKAARRQGRKPRETSTRANPPDRHERAQRFLRDTLAEGPKRVTDVEAAASKAHVDPHALDQARAELGVVTSRGSAGGVMAVQWSLPG
jgi:hypothetical protein